MHTAICTFEERTLAEQAVERLVQAGFARQDIHLEQRHPDGSPMEQRDHDVVGKFSFFERLFGAGKHAPHADSYSQAVERGLYVVLVEHEDEAEAERAQNVLHGMEARDVNLLHRAGQPPLRDVVTQREAGDMGASFGTARSEMGGSHAADVKGPEGEFFPAERPRELERPIASNGGWGEQDKLQVVDDDRPIASPSLPTRDEDKPR
jgi:hypothetical protein